MSTDVLIRHYQDGDAESLAELIRMCLIEINSQDYPNEIIDRIVDVYSPEMIADLADYREMFVAEVAGRVAGTVSREGNRVYTMFVSPELGRRGIGNSLMSHIEELARAEGYGHMDVESSITAHDYYQKRGYVDTGTRETELGLNYLARKAL